MKYRTQILILATILAFSTPAISLASTGFVDSPLWISPATPSEGNMVTLSALFRNEEQRQISGTVVFYDGDVLLGRKTVTIATGSVATASVTFKIGAGDHNFSAQMSSLSETLSSGATEPIALPITSAKYPRYFVPKTIGVPISAQAGSKATGSPEKLLLDQVDNAQNAVLDVVPSNFKTSVLENTKSVESWRENVATSLIENRDNADKTLVKIKTDTATQIKKSGGVSATTKFVDRPLAYLKWSFFAVLAFIFASPWAFYIVGILALFFIVRFIFRKIRKVGKKD